jgi:hypothetical protein
MHTHITKGSDRATEDYQACMHTREQAMQQPAAWCWQWEKQHSANHSSNSTGHPTTAQAEARSPLTTLSTAAATASSDDCVTRVCDHTQTQLTCHTIQRGSMRPSSGVSAQTSGMHASVKGCCCFRSQPASSQNQLTPTACTCGQQPSGTQRICSHRQQRTLWGVQSGAAAATGSDARQHDSREQGQGCGQGLWQSPKGGKHCSLQAMQHESSAMHGYSPGNTTWRVQGNADRRSSSSSYLPVWWALLCADRLLLRRLLQHWLVGI